MEYIAAQITTHSVFQCKLSNSTTEATTRCYRGHHVVLLGATMRCYRGHHAVLQGPPCGATGATTQCYCGPPHIINVLLTRILHQTRQLPALLILTTFVLFQSIIMDVLALPSSRELLSSRPGTKFSPAPYQKTGKITSQLR